jgi:NAD(P)-dependent dehydrogenase (short-subunit alcohol dehydrogenase family)
MDTTNKTAVITGGASGIGAALAAAIQSRGGQAIIVDIDGEAAEAKAAELGDGVSAMACDVSDVAAVEAMAEAAWPKLGGVDLVFANAGLGVGRPLLKATEAEFDITLNVNLKGVWATAKAFATRMIANDRGGHICLTGSEHSLGLQHPGNGFYTAAKHGVLALGDVFRAELPETIGMSVLCPGLTATGIGETSVKAAGLDAPNLQRAAMVQAVMAAGKPASEVAAETLAAIERGDFLIMTECSAYAAAERRADEVKAAFAAQAPMGGADEMKYHVDTVVAKLRGKAT